MNDNRNLISKFQNFQNYPEHLESTKFIAWFESTKIYLNGLESNKIGYNCLLSTNIDLNERINSIQQQVNDLESENLQIDHVVTLSQYLS